MARFSAPPCASRRRFLHRLSLSSLALGGGLHWLRAADAPAEDLLRGRDKLGVALVGLGSYAGGQLAPSLRETKLCRFAGAVTGEAQKGRAWAREYGFPESSVYHYDGMDDLADNPEIDIVYVVTPPGFHREPAEKAARAGKHVICEKPMAPSVEDCDAMIRTCEDNGVLLSIGYRLHFHPYHQRVKALARSEEWGAFERLSGGFGFPVNHRSWRLTEEMGGGPLMDVGIYVIQSACMAKAGEAPESVTAQEHEVTRPELFDEVEEGIDFQLRWADGAVCEGTTSFARYSNRFRAEADRGWIELDPAFSYDGIAGRTSEGRLEKITGFNQQARQMDGFAECILRGTPSSVPGEMGRRDIAIIEAIFRAAKSGQRERVEA
ncbi:MAG: Gfo/Idh/MocA family protein [Opitutales bacterium]